MAKQTIDLGTTANDNTGDNLRTAGQKINENFDEVYATGVDLTTAQTIAGVKTFSDAVELQGGLTGANVIPTYIVGDAAGGGLVAQVLGGNQYLIVSSVKVSFSAPYGTLGTVTGATSLTDGSSNTDIMIAIDPLTPTAATLARGYNGGGFNDWYLPAKNELIELNTNKVILNIANGYYWSSTEISNNQAWDLNFSTELPIESSKTYGDGLYAVRQFTATLSPITITVPTKSGALALISDIPASAIALNTAKETNIAHPLVEKAVPSDALFTDTVYNDTAILAAVALNTAKATNAAHTGDVTGDTALTIANEAITIAKLSNELKGIFTLPTGNNAINFGAYIQYDKTLDAAWVPTFTNPVKGKFLTIIATGGAYTLTLPASVKGDISAFDGTLTNQLQFYCLDAVTPVYSVTLLNW